MQLFWLFFFVVVLPLCALIFLMIKIKNCPHESTFTVLQTYESATNILLKKETICNRCGQLIDTEY